VIIGFRDRVDQEYQRVRLELLTAVEIGGAPRSKMAARGGVAVGSVPSSVRLPPSPLGVLETVCPSGKPAWNSGGDLLV
jgi:hypothetical protein